MTKPKTNHTEQLIYPFDSEEFFEIWQLWKDYKKEQFRFTFKGVISEQAQLKRLGELSFGDEKYAIEIINYAISQTWRGLFPIPLKEQQNGKPKSIFDKIGERRFGT